MDEKKDIWNLRKKGYTHRECKKKDWIENDVKNLEYFKTL